MTRVGAGQAGAVSPIAGCQREGELAMLMGKEPALSSLSSGVSLDFSDSLTPDLTDGAGTFFLPLPESPGHVRVTKEHAYWEARQTALPL